MDMKSNVDLSMDLRFENYTIPWFLDNPSEQYTGLIAR
jgi:hypothetical protein